jgi:hypothetical protein
MPVDLACRRPVLRIVEDGREAPFQFPGGKEESPVDVGHEVGEIDVDLARPGE